ncbi:MAG: hypothetical protein K2X47_03130 [Bdellovibrionales bacterium]|nr:hypothetical protein [Bdellovibrionales bacterium]
MASASASDVFNCSQSEFFKIIADFDKYPEFLPEVKACRVVEIQGNRKLVEFEHELRDVVAAVGKLLRSFGVIA